MSDSPQLSDLQLAIMRVLWDRGEASVADVQGSLDVERALALTTVATLLSRLEKRQLVIHRTIGRQFVYRALVSEREVRGSMVGDLASRLFRGDVAEMVSHLLSARDVTREDLDRVKALIDAKTQDTESES